MAKSGPESGHSSRTEPNGSPESTSTPSTITSLSGFEPIEPSPPPPPLPEMLSVPGYEILGELGRGGMGVVYRARQVSLKRLVALKMLRDGVLANPQHLARFRAEAETVACLQHPNIVHIYEIGDLKGRPFFSMELIEGANLKEKIAGSPQAPEQAAHLAEILARAVHHVHERGILHRDLKPGNILLSPMSPTPSTQARWAFDLAKWTPKVTDFGLAKQVGGEGSLTPTGCPIGTASYMPPEQAIGDKRISFEADVYALGAILYELMTGRPPFTGETWLEILDRVRGHKPIPPTTICPQVPGDLEAICLKCLEKDPLKRYRSAEALAHDLRSFRERKPIAALAAPDLVGERLRKHSSVHDLKFKQRVAWAANLGYEIMDVRPTSNRISVYLARHVASGSLVTLKILGAPVKEERLAELYGEAEVLGCLQHPNIPRVLGAGELEGQHFLAVEYIEGTTLREHMQTNRPTPAEAAGLIEALARTLHHAHQQNVVHADFQPAWIRLMRDGSVRLLNFGIGRREDLNQMTGSQMVSMLRYLAPEQTKSESTESTPATNLYTLGTIFYEILAGRPPFEMGSFFSALEQLSKQPPTPPSHFEPAVPRALDEVCLKCLRKEPHDRFASAGALGDALRDFLKGV